jgi:hypothetical protein
MSTSRIRPDRRHGYGYALLVAVVGMTTALVWGVTAVLDQLQQPAEFARAAIPGSLTVTLTQLGPHVVYYESAGPAVVRADQLSVVDGSGQVVAVRPYRLDLRYDVPGRPATLGTAIAVFDADRTGSFVIRTDATVAADRALLAVGDDLAPALVRAVAPPALTGLLSLVAAITLAAGTWSWRERKDQP